MSLTPKEIVAHELHKPARKNYKRRRVIIKGLHDLWQADLVEMQPYAKSNKGFRYILVVINAFSKYVWVMPLKSKKSKDVTLAFEAILRRSKNPPKNLHTDLGTEFYNRNFSELVKKYKINHYSTFSNLKASIVERVNRTLKNIMWRQFTIQGNYKWLDILEKIVQKYNNTVHRTTGYKPNSVDNKNAEEILSNSYSHLKTVDPKKPKLKVNDFVRISKHREAFDKGYTPNWSSEIFQIQKVQLTNPTSYLLKDYNNEDVQGGFYEEELQKVKYPDVYLVEKILKQKGDKVYVKWLGFSNSNNSWILKKHIL